MKNQTWTIIRKELSRFFGDRALFFTTVIMPGLLIYFIYSVMGSSMTGMMTENADEPTTVYVSHKPESLSPMLGELPVVMVEEDFEIAAVREELSSRECNKAVVVFPESFDSLVTAYNSASGEPAPNVEIYYNSTNEGSNGAYMMLSGILEQYEDNMSNKFDVNRSDSEDASFNQASEAEEIGNILSSLIPMLIMTLLFSGCMAVAPTAIAGEKERGTIATLLVTPMKRSQLALGKIVALSFIALLSGLSSFLGIILSLPKLLAGESDVELSGMAYTFNDYLFLLLIILVTVLVLVAIVSILSALAKSVKSAGTMITPLMLIVIVVGLIPMISGGTEDNPLMYLIPFYNSVESMSCVFAYNIQTLPILLTIISNLFYTGLAVWVLTRLFNSERAMFGR